MKTNSYTFSKPARITSQDYSWTQFVKPTLSIGCDFVMMCYYNRQLEKAYSLVTVHLNEELIQTIKQKRLEHMVSGVLKGVGLIVLGILAMQDNESKRVH